VLDDENNNRSANDYHIEITTKVMLMPMMNLILNMVRKRMIVVMKILSMRGSIKILVIHQRVVTHSDRITCWKDRNNHLQLFKTEISQIELMFLLIKHNINLKPELTQSP